MSSRKEKLLAGGMGLVLACAMSLFGVSNAFAASGTTNVTLEADDANISVTVPIDMVGKIKSDGTILYPTTTFFQNNSIFGVHVASVSVGITDPYKVVSNSNFDAAADANVLWTKIQPTDGSAHDITTSSLTAGDWDLDKSGEVGSRLGITLEGAIKNLNSVPDGTTKAYTLTWTIAAGSAA